jgi:rod shape-determining protein MreC
MKYVATDEKVEIGEHIITSGMDKIFPGEIPIGTVMEVKPGNPFKQIRVQPAAKLDRLETVIVLLTQAPVEFKQETATENLQPGTPASGSEPGAQSSAPVAPKAAEKP